MNETPPVTHDADLDRADRGDKWRTAAYLLAFALVIVMAWAMYSANSTSQNKATSEASQKYTLGQQVAAACALSTRADDLGGLCTTAQKIVKEGPAGTPGLSGPPGDTGPQGPLGPKGEQGVRGFTGIIGAMGPQGIFGKTGDQGVTGDQGKTGPSGDRGVAGTDGTTGATGAVGAAGPAGANSTVPGPAGPPGPAGADGLPGAIGAPGPAGPNGQTPTAMTCTKNAAPANTGWDCTVTAWRP